MTSTPFSDPVRKRLPDADASDAFGAALARLVIRGVTNPAASSFAGFTIHFSGGLGAGKTTIVRALLRGLGVEGRIKSPTYTLVEPYVVRLPKSIESRRNVNLYCYHFDFYRFEDPHEWFDAGFRDDFADAALRLVEWPERVRSADGSLLPTPDLRVSLEDDVDGRQLALAAATATGAEWLSAADPFGPSSPVVAVR